MTENDAPTPAVPVESCGGCRYGARGVAPVAGASRTVDCRAHPTVVQKHADGWCGEWKAP